MAHNLPDIDIDFADRKEAIIALGGTPAVIIKDGKIKKHNTGMYYTDIPTDTMTGYASIDHKVAEGRGYFKLDFLNLGVYDRVKNETHLEELIAKVPNWKRLGSDPAFTSKVIHIGSYFTLLRHKLPHTIEQMAMMLAIIRPGKKHLQHLDWNAINKTIWDIADTDGYAFKKSHATSYAMAVVVNMNLIEEEENA